MRLRGSLEVSGSLFIDSVVHPPPRERRQPHKDRQLELIPRGECVTVWQSGELKGRQDAENGEGAGICQIIIK